MNRIMIAAAIASVALSGAASAATLNGTYTINIRNFADTDSDPTIVTSTNSAATRTNVDAVGIDATVQYTGDLNFSVTTGQNVSTYIDDFLTSGGGSYSILFGDQTFLDTTQLSLGDYSVTTFFEILGSFAGDALNGVITHDDGITLEAVNQTGGVSAPPTSKKITNFTADAGEFTLLYAAANGNPSILNVQADISPVPLPAGAVLLLTGLAGFGVARRRRKAA